MRYFIVTGVIKEGRFFGCTNFHLALQCENYPSIQNINKEVHKKGAIIINIIELNKDDYESFLGKVSEVKND